MAKTSTKKTETNGKAPSDDGKTVIEIPVNQLPNNGNMAYGSLGHVDVTLDADQNAGLNRLFGALHHSSTRLANGRHIDTKANAIRWLLEQINQSA